MFCDEIHGHSNGIHHDSDGCGSRYKSWACIPNPNMAAERMPPWLPTNPPNAPESTRQPRGARPESQSVRVPEDAHHTRKNQEDAQYNRQNRIVDADMHQRSGERSDGVDNAET
jgi:hypothetical protein